MKCPVCGKFEFEEYADFDICPVCNGENDNLQFAICNMITINEYFYVYSHAITNVIPYPVSEKIIFGYSF